VFLTRVHRDRVVGLPDVAKVPRQVLETWVEGVGTIRNTCLEIRA
jgi:hypothetical protein